MKKRHLLKTMLLLFALIVGVGSAWAADVTLTQSSLGLTGSYTTNTEKEIGGITYVYTDLMKNNDNIQAKASSGVIYNKTAFPGDIKSVAITHSGTARATTILGSSNGTDWIQVATGSGSITGDFSNKGYKYFKITRGSNAAYWTKIEITYEQGGSNLTPSDLALTDAPVALSFDLYNNSSAQTINYTTSSTGAVTVSANDYVTTSVNATAQTITVTPKNAVTPETQTITVSQAADDTYAAGQVTFTVNITNSDPNVPGTQINPYTVAQARAAIDAGTGTQGVYATGIVSEIVTAYSSDYSNVTFDIVDEAGTSGSLRAYRCGGTEAANVAVGDVVVVSGNLIKYGDTYEFAQGCQIVSLTHSTIPIINADDVEIEYNATSGEIPYTINNPVDGVSLTATTTAEWISNFTVASDKVTFTATANDGAERTATVTLTYDTQTKEVTVTQAAYVAPFEGATYTLASSITPGKHYIITDGYDKAMGEQNDNNRAAVGVTISDRVATVESADVFEFVIYGPDADGYYTIFDAKNDGYLYAASSSKNYLRTHTDYTGDARWKIEFGEEKVASIVAQGTYTRNVMKYNSGSTLFSCYASNNNMSAVYLYEKDGDTAPTTESVTVSSVSYATYSSENALNFSNTGIIVYTAKANGTSVSLTPVSDGIVPAYTGVVLYANGGASAIVPVATSKGTTDWTNNEMVANVKRAKVYLTEGDKTNYILSNEDAGVGFYKAAANGAYLPANRAYLSTTATATGNAPFLGFDGNETTGINSVERGALSVEGCYTLDGRRVAQPTKGLYIVNGRKVIIK